MKLKKLNNNFDVRKAIEDAGLYKYEIAEALGVCDSGFSKMLRKELPEEKKKEIFGIIERLKCGN